MDFKKLISNDLFQIVVLIILFWFLFLKEGFNELVPISNMSCKKCTKFVYNDLSKISKENFNKKNCSL